MSDDRPDIPPDDYNKPVGGGDLPPLDLLPTREWLGSKIIDVEYRIVIFNSQIQYLMRQVEGGEDEAVLDDNNEKIPRREFYITFEMHNYSLPNGNPRRSWLQMGASLGENAHLPTFLGNTLGWDHEAKTPTEIINALKGMEVKLQLKNKPRKDKTKPPYQQVVFDAVECLQAPKKEEPATPMTENDVQPPENKPECKCVKEDQVADPEKKWYVQNLRWYDYRLGRIMIETLQRWNHNKEKLEKSPAYKVKRFVELKRIIKIKEGEWKCLPVQGYNITTYTMIKDLAGWRCNCQGFSKREDCSHLQALMIVKPNDKQDLF